MLVLLSREDLAKYGVADLVALEESEAIPLGDLLGRLAGRDRKAATGSARALELHRRAVALLADVRDLIDSGQISDRWGTEDPADCMADVTLALQTIYGTTLEDEAAAAAEAAQPAGQEGGSAC